MLFNSFAFVIFILVVLGVYYSLSRKRQNLFLVAASYFFYGWWDWRFTLLLMLSTAVDYFCGLKIGSSENQKIRKLLLLVSVCTNLGILACFKYFNFFAENIHHVLEWAGLRADLPLMKILLPVGISFYTFQTMAYTVDVYRGHERPCRQFLDFALYVSFFPQLVAGPIERSVQLLPQFQKERRITPRLFHAGCQLILMGYFKKMLIADTAAPLVDRVFENIHAVRTGDLLFGIYLFSLQIYGDFAGYTDIARGVSKLLGIDLCVNFRQPYLAASITEFWRRWHISLSSWLRDYLYISLGGNRRGALKTHRNIMITMLLGGLWHGASWNFVIWGGLHGLCLSFHKLLSSGRKIRQSVNPGGEIPFFLWLFKVFATFNLVCLAWIFFRARTLPEAVEYIMNLFSLAGAREISVRVHGLSAAFLFLGILSFLVDYFCWKRDTETPFDERWPVWVRGGVYAGMILLLVLVGEDNAQPFIYFQF